MIQDSRIKKGQSKLPIVILHGWRVEGSRYDSVKSIFEKKGYKVFSPTMPGAGNVPLLKPVMHVDDYVSFVLNFLHKEKITKVILICHSFGGRVGTKLTARNPERVEKLILTGTPLIKQPLSLKKKILSVTASVAKKIIKKSFAKESMRKILYLILGEWDYYKAPKEIRETFKAIISEDIAPNLPNIKAPTLVLWGECDTFVPKIIGRQIAQQIPGATYKEIAGASHKLPYENPDAFAREVEAFIK